MRAAFCRFCGASEDSGWNESEFGDDAAGDDFDYDEFVAREFPDPAAMRTEDGMRRWVVRIVVALVCLSLLLWSLKLL